MVIYEELDVYVSHQPPFYQISLNISKRDKLRSGDLWKESIFPMTLPPVISIAEM